MKYRLRQVQGNPRVKYCTIKLTQYCYENNCTGIEGRAEVIEDIILDGIHGCLLTAPKQKKQKSLVVEQTFDTKEIGTQTP